MSSESPLTAMLSPNRLDRPRMDTAAPGSGGTGGAESGRGVGTGGALGGWAAACGIVAMDMPDGREPAGEKWAGFPAVSRLMRSGYHAIALSDTP